ncbi:hypothetical protein [Cognataquiflexum rubidum]|uniref:hypothetical protein n=1 Tax=Cognataquiflexum rubidum TaxID=2922273 RepID=UPI001F13AE32|nr:hypothetical protein [Cognataquiflexum rubidum]MCH6235043.1 hypothetical protein [Cognataquiflexum rubidum]
MNEQILQTMRLLLFLPMLAGLTLSAGVTNAQTVNYEVGSEPTITTDKDDYAPWEIAFIAGTGWAPETLVDSISKKT